MWVFAALAVTRYLTQTTGISIKKFVTNLRSGSRSSMSKRKHGKGKKPTAFTP